MVIDLSWYRPPGPLSRSSEEAVSHRFVPHLYLIADNLMPTIRARGNPRQMQRDAGTGANVADAFVADRPTWPIPHRSRTNAKEKKGSPYDPWHVDRDVHAGARCHQSHRNCFRAHCPVRHARVTPDAGLDRVVPADHDPDQRDRLSVPVHDAAAVAHCRHHIAGGAGDRAACALWVRAPRGMAVDLRGDCGRGALPEFVRRGGGVGLLLDSFGGGGEGFQEVAFPARWGAPEAEPAVPDPPAGGVGFVGGARLSGGVKFPPAGGGRGRAGLIPRGRSRRRLSG